MFAVNPKSDCPHILENVSSSYLAAISVHKPCDVCKDASENWICFKCGQIFCSRYVNSHMVKHNEETGHSIVASFSDLSTWCYNCDTYIKHPSLQLHLDALHRSKFSGNIGNSNEGKGNIPEKEEETVQDNKGTNEKAADAENEIENAKDMHDGGGKSPEEGEEVPLEVLQQLLSRVQLKTEVPPPEKILSALTLEGVADFINSGKCKNIIVMTGAGVSVAAGIPDFRTPGTGLYYNLQKYNLPYPTAVFEIDYFRKKPEPFYLLAKELYPGTFKPTYAHHFIKLLSHKGLLLRNYTQNIDTLERCAGIEADLLVEAHGSFATSHCIDCHEEHEHHFVKECVFSQKVPRCTKCQGLVKPDIVFFGEGLPKRFFELAAVDFGKCDLLLVIGTSLKVQPFASLIKRVTPSTPRLLINMEEVGIVDLYDYFIPGSSTGFIFEHPQNVRDVKWLGDCQEGVKKLAELLGWGEELESLVQRSNASATPKF
jgi:NAD-dependent deacetylase sirtuin 2